jgi:hypothetical protein
LAGFFIGEQPASETAYVAVNNPDILEGSFEISQVWASTCGGFDESTG